LTLRELVWRYSAITYFQFMLSGTVVAGIFNSKRQKKTDKVWRWTDCHPWHSPERTGISSHRLMSLAMSIAGDVEWEFAPGYSLERIIGGDIDVSKSD